MPHIEEPMRVMDVPGRPQCDPDHIKIIHVGAGASGLLFAYKARKWLQNYELVCYEKNDMPGGTWFESRYPGCACDIPAHTYTFPFEQKWDWSGYYSYSHEIQEYMMDFYRRHELEPYIKLNTEVLSATWDAREGIWHVELKRKDGSPFQDTCHVLVNGSGVVNKWKWPAIEGLHDFKGKLVHSACWDESLDWAGKKVAVIGTGSSSIQMVPYFQKSAEHLTVFMRNCTYIGPPFASDVSNKEADPEAQDPTYAGKHHYTEKEKQRFRDDPEYLHSYRTKVEQHVVGNFKMFYRGSELNLSAKKAMQDAMLQKLEAKKELQERFVPNWSPGCRRLTPGEGYLEALVSDNVSTVHSEIVKVTPTGIVDADGTEHELDIIACATGFHVQYLPHFKITGTDGQVMQDQTEPNVYASVATPGFPNYFICNGPRGNWGQGCILPSMEGQHEYMLQCIKHMQEDQIKSIVPKQEVTKQLNLYMDAWHNKHSVWAEDCRSWYKDNRPNGRVYLWCGSLLHHLKFMKKPRFEHYEIEYKDPENIFAFLGHGQTIGEDKYGKDVPVPYIRLGDTPWDIE